MKTFLAALLLVATQANAGPYFRPIDTSHVYQSVGASVDPKTPGQTCFISEIALITHSPKDGCLLPSIVCEDWSPLMIGPSYNAGRFAVVLGPVANVAPFVYAGISRVLGIDYKPSDTGTSIAFGPQLWINPLRDGVCQPFNKWMPAGRVFVGAALKF